MNLNFLNEFDFFTGVPDSQLRPLCDYLINKFGIGKHHIIAANEGNAVGLAAGYYLSTKKIPVVYLQNSGIGNIINPVASLLNKNVYGIPCIFIVGWRGEPNISDEPQHKYQGMVTIQLLNDMNIKTFVISKETTEIEVINKLKEWKTFLNDGNQVAFIIKKSSLDFEISHKYSNIYNINREEAIRKIKEISGKDCIISSTGKITRELFAVTEQINKDHEKNFLNVGSMGHNSSIAFSIAIHNPNMKVWCLDGDGAVLMHMGSMAIIGANKPKNFIHIVFNNCAHESVGGMPTVGNAIDFVKIAEGCGYSYFKSVKTLEDLENELIFCKKANQLSFIEIKCSIESRNDLGRPTTSCENIKNSFINYLSKNK